MDKAKAYIDEHKERFVGELFELLRIPSVSAQSVHAPDVVRCAELLAGLLVRSGADRAEVMPTEGNPIVYAEKIVDPAAKTVLVYGHYDVMPVDPVDEWRTSPFEPVVKDGRIWCRGADDDKGQLFMHAKAFEAMCATDSLPCNVKFLLEGAKTENMTEKEQAKIVKSQEFTRKFEKAMDDDFNTADAIAAVFDLVKFINTNTDGESSKEYLQNLLSQLVALTDVLGIIVEKEQEMLADDIEALIAERQAARKERNFARADEIRDELLAKGIILEDTREGVKWKRA